MPTRNMSRCTVRYIEGRDGFERPVTRHQSYSKDQLASHSLDDGAVTLPTIGHQDPKTRAPIHRFRGGPNELLLYDVRQHAPLRATLVKVRIQVFMDERPQGSTRIG
jgi:hypothetical protein